MAHDNYDSFYTWNGGTLVLDPGVFAYDEPHLRMCHRTPVQATGLDRVIDPLEQRYCAKPMEMMSSKHASIPIETAARCDTIIPGRSYCCSPYVMPNDWRVDYRALGNDGAVEGPMHATDIIVQDGAIIIQRAQPTLSGRIREKPLLSAAIALLGGIVIGRMMERP
ncbi:MAG: hypothetical protein ACYS7Y_16630 [Planctomycetota bacterium]|jgi:hypothetical protein